MIFHVYANRSNIGDWLSAKGIQDLLFPLRVQELYCDTPFAAGTLETLSRATEEDFIVIGGGGLFMDYFEPFWNGFRKIASRVPFCIWGVGCCHIKRFSSRPSGRLIREIVRASQFCYVRDNLTRKFLNGSGVVISVPCPAFNALHPTAAEGKWLLNVDHFDVIGEAQYARTVEITRADAKRTGHSFRQTNNLIPAGNSRALQDVLNLYIGADRVVTSRLHGCIIALALGRRVLAISGDHKVESFMAAAGLSDWVCGLSEIEELPERLEKLPRQPIPAEFVERVRRQNQGIAAELRQLLKHTEVEPSTV